MEFKTEIEKLDTKEIVSSKYINWEHYKNSSVMVTGATGLIGSQIIKALLYANEIYNLNIQITALIRNIEKANKIFGKEPNITYLVQDISTPINCDKKIDYIIHTANSTASKTFVEQPVETIDSIIVGTKNILEYAKTNNVKSLVYLSSMEVFGQTNFDRNESLKEKDYGYIDILQVRSSYPEGKRLAETLCKAYSSEYSVPVKIARLVQTIGAGVDYNDNRVFVQFAKSVLNNNDIVLHTAGASSRSYCYITDAVTAILVILERGLNGNCYNVANEETNASIKEMAEMLCNKYQNIKVKFEFDNKCYPPDSKLHVDTSELKSLNWNANIALMEMYNRLIENFRILKNSDN